MNDLLAMKKLNSKAHDSNEVAKLRAFCDHVSYVPICISALCYYVPTCPHFSLAYVPIYIFRAYLRSFFTCLRAYNHSQNIVRLTSVPRIPVFLWTTCITN